MKWYRGQRLRRIRRLVIAAALIFCSYGVWALDSLERGYLGDFPALFSMAFARIWHVPSAPYDLYATDTESRGTIPFDVNWPTEPSQSTTVSAATVGELQTQINSGARRINYSGSSTSGISIGSDDVWIYFEDGAQVGDVSVTASVQRLKLTAETPRNNVHVAGSFVVADGCADIMCDGIYFSSTGSFDQIALYDFVRVAFINCRTVYSDNYNIASWNNNASDTDSLPAKSDLIIANVSSDDNGFGNLRIQGVDRCVIVDVLADGRGSTYASLRLEFNTRNVWVRNFTGFGGGCTLDPRVGTPARVNATVHDVWYYDSGVYNDGTINSGLISFTDSQGDISDASKVYNITLGAFDFYSDSYTPGSNIGGVQYGTWTVADSTYADFTSYPTWSFQ